MSETFMIAGLGNPGPDYEHTRHNAGFDAIDVLAKQLGAHYWKSEGGALCAHVNHGDIKLILVKPQNYMNTSGGPLSSVAKLYGIIPERVIVIHDELDIAPGSLRVKFGGGHAGHNGLRSIIDKFQSREFYRVRVGIGRPPGRMPVADYVLRRPKAQEQELFEETCSTAADAVIALVDRGLEKTQQSFNS